MPAPLRDTRDLFVGLDYETPLLDGSRRRYVNLDNAATTPPLRAVMDYVNRTAEWYSSVHRGTGHKSQRATHAFESYRRRLSEFLGLDPEYHVLTFCANSTDAINRVAARFAFAPDDVVLVSTLEHHSNLLPWRLHGRVEYVRAHWPCGVLDMGDLEAQLRRHAGHVRLVAVTGASNVTGLVPPLGQVARLAHEHGAQVLVDASQLVAHRALNAGHSGDPERFDFLVCSGHKMYAPFGSGCLAGPRAFFEAGSPPVPGGGAVEFVSFDDVAWAEVPDKEEAGTPNLMGIGAMAESARVLQELGLDSIARQERYLTRATLDALGSIAGVRIYGGCGDLDECERVGVIPIQADGMDHALLAAVLAYEWGIGVRNGCFCAQPYVGHLLRVGPDEAKRHLAGIKAGRPGRHERPGFVRVSLALYNTEDDVARLVEALTAITRQGPRGRYRMDEKSGQYAPEGFAFEFSD
jgi:selenocysteine lyase/cysteine desulfurase